MELTAELIPTNPLRFILELPGSLISVEYRPEKHAVPCNHQGMQVRPQVCCAASIFVEHITLLCECLCPGRQM